jgi:hypothetical protein
LIGQVGFSLPSPGTGCLYLDLDRHRLDQRCHAAEHRRLESGLYGRDLALVAPHHDLLGVTPPDQDPAKAAPDHSPKFFVDARALGVGTRTMASLAVNFLSAEPKEKESLRPSRPFVQEDR